jgi:hypothetical protein
MVKCWETFWKLRFSLNIKERTVAAIRSNGSLSLITAVKLFTLKIVLVLT